MQKIILYLALALFCFSAPKEETPLKSAQMGWFLGAGLGGGLEKLQSEGTDLVKNTKNYASLLTSAKIGRYNRFTPLIGLRYYYNLDLSVNFADPQYSPLAEDFGFFLITQSHTLNTDIILNAYSQGKHSFSFIGGIGLGLAIQTYNQRFETRYGFSQEEGRFTLGLEGRVNLGVQWMFEQKYGLEFMAKIPFTPGMVIEHKDSGPLVVLGERKITTHPYYFTLNFLMEF